MSGGTVRDLLAGLRAVGECRALSVLEEALRHHGDEETQMTDERSGEQTHTLQSDHMTVTMTTGHSAVVCPSAGVSLVQDLKVDVRIDSGVCDSGVELSTA